MLVLQCNKNISFHSSSCFCATLAKKNVTLLSSIIPAISSSRLLRSLYQNFFIFIAKMFIVIIEAAIHIKRKFFQLAVEGKYISKQICNILLTFNVHKEKIIKKNGFTLRFVPRVHYYTCRSCLGLNIIFCNIICCAADYLRFSIIVYYILL